MIERASSVPIYGSMSAYLGHGSVGGFTFDTTGAANLVTDMAIRLANGAPLREAHGAAPCRHSP